ncbi:MAG TPA: DUF6268 family outer membrane beta-barrel protein [Flavitalea sp.]|nr:DUF6268 family outer membrane beta-barrel protein [Flavitalea sp.]
MKRPYIAYVIFLNLLAATITCNAQPFIDLLNIQHVNSPDRGLINQNKNATTLKNFAVQTTIPFQLKNKRDAIIFSPSFETWSAVVGTSQQEFEKYYGLSLPVSFLKTLPNEDWSILSTLIVRRNGYEIGLKNNWQIGGAVVVNFKANENLKYKLGIYANREFFGLFVMPLFGIDWQISKKTNLFGILPGTLTLEHKLKKKLYTGASFRAITSSYRTPTGYWRLDENRLGVFLDYCFSKHVAVNVETGHSILRNMIAGEKDNVEIDWKAKDNLYVKLSLAYRIRLR